MAAREPCPYCGEDPGRQALAALYAEVARIREIAERQQAEQETIAHLSQEVRMLRETVARLRGTSATKAAGVAAATGGCPSRREATRATQVSASHTPAA